MFRQLGIVHNAGQINNLLAVAAPGYRVDEVICGFLLLIRKIARRGRHGMNKKIGGIYIGIEIS